MLDETEVCYYTNIRVTGEAGTEKTSDKASNPDEWGEFVSLASPSCSSLAHPYMLMRLCTASPSRREVLRLQQDS